jgi:DNA-binding NarL/FixJ family response regulator
MNSSSDSSSDEKIRVLVVDDHPVVRQGVVQLISDQSDMEVCGEADSQNQAIESISRLRPHVAVVDLRLKNSSGLELVRQIHEEFPDTVPVVLTMRSESFYAERALRAGAQGYLTKDEPCQRILEGIRQCCRGEVCLSPSLASRMLQNISDRDHPAEGEVSHLSDRELEVFEYLGRGLATREIADTMHISTKTVDSYREHIKKKLHLHSAAELIRRAILWAQCQQDSAPR